MNCRLHRLAMSAVLVNSSKIVIGQGAPSKATAKHSSKAAAAVYLGKPDEGFAKLDLVGFIQLQAGLFSFPSLLEVILVVTVHKDGMLLLHRIQNLVRDLQAGSIP